jgi:ABC-2 type transport system ATP-binding protein
MSDPPTLPTGGDRTGLDIDGLAVRFGDLVALDGVSFGVEPGQLVGFLGPNGAGKTTTMRAVVGLLRSQAGTVSWNGRPITEDVRRRIGYMPEERGLYVRMKVLEEVTYFGRLAGLSARDADVAAREWLGRLGLGERLDELVQNLSHGNQQRVQLAVALVHDPELLILDEPFSGLDPVAVTTMTDVIAERAAAGAAVLFSSHQLDLVEDLCEDVVIIDHGKVVVAGTVTGLRASSPTRELTVTYADGTVASRTVPRDADLEALLDDARRKGTISALSFEPPSLGELFLEVVRR